MEHPVVPVSVQACQKISDQVSVAKESMANINKLRKEGQTAVNFAFTEVLHVTMASSPVDPLQTLQAALTAQANSKEQADLLAVLRESLENHPKPIPILLQTLINNLVNAGDSLLKRWVLDLFHYAICRSSLTLDQKTHSSCQH